MTDSPQDTKTSGAAAPTGATAVRLPPPSEEVRSYVASLIAWQEKSERPDLVIGGPSCLGVERNQDG